MTNGHAEGARILLFPGGPSRRRPGRQAGSRASSRKLKIKGLPSGTVVIDGPRRRRVKASQVHVYIGESASGVHVSLHRTDEPAWTTVVSQMTGAAPVPWPVLIRHEGPSSATVVIDCPTTAPISWSVNEPSS